MAKRRSKSKRNDAILNETGIKAIVTFLVLLLAFGVLLLFNTYQQNILSSPLSFQFFVLLVVILFALLIGLLFLLNPHKK